MLKKWKCSMCEREVLAFDEDILAHWNPDSFQQTKPPINNRKCGKDSCMLQEIPDHNQSTLHGEAGFSVEGTVLDSMETIHDYEKTCIEKAADERELKHFAEARKMV